MFPVSRLIWQNGQRPNVRLSGARLHLQADGRDEEEDPAGESPVLKPYFNPAAKNR